MTANHFVYKRAALKLKRDYLLRGGYRVIMRPLKQTALARKRRGSAADAKWSVIITKKRKIKK